MSLVQRSHSSESEAELTRTNADSHEQASGADGIPPASANYGRYSLIGALVLLIGIGGSVVWSATAPLSSAVISNGLVVVEGSRKTIQHLEGGIVAAVYVDEGDHVRQGDLLIEFDTTQATSELDVTEARLLASLGRQARLRAERDNLAEVRFPAELIDADNQAMAREIMVNQLAIFAARRQALATELDLRAQRIREFEEQIRGLQARLEAVETQIISFVEEVFDWEELVSEQLADKQALRDAHRQLNQHHGERGRLIADIAVIRAQIVSNEMERSLRQEEYDLEVADGLGDVQERILESRARISALRDRLGRTAVTASIDGSVVGLRVHSRGGVVRPGDSLMDIVPRQRRLLVDVQVPPEQIDNIRVGQDTDLVFTAFDTLFVRNIEGVVVSVSADALTDEQNGERYFLARIRVNEAGLRTLEEEDFRLEPGMPAQAFIKTGERSFFGYLVRPFSEMALRAFREN